LLILCPLQSEVHHGPQLYLKFTLFCQLLQFGVLCLFLCAQTILSKIFRIKKKKYYMLWCLYF